jgi:dTDP-4-dehydrorhamnose 3,5-epimerase
MIYKETKLKGAFIIELEKIKDERGFFARSWCANEFKSRGLDSFFVQSNISFNKKKDTIRGMHYQIAPFEETKLIRCNKGAIYDVIIDLRPDSATYKQWIAVELTEYNYRILYVPKGFAHGYQTLVDNTEVFYQVSQFYSPEHERGIRWNDPAFNIKWQGTGEKIISEKDRNWPDFQDLRNE